MSERPDDLDSLWFALSDRDAVAAALTAEAAAAGYLPVDPEELAPYGRWLHGEEDPTVRRYAVAPSSNGWTGVFPSHPDWDHDFAPAIAARLGCRAACLMLHDGDVFTLHLHDGAELTAAHVSSPVHFDRAPRAAGDLGIDEDLVVSWCRAGTTRDGLRRALTPKGAIDVDGRLALERVAALLGIGAGALLSYSLLVDERALALSETFSDHLHVTFRVEDGDGEAATDTPAEGGQLLQFPGGSGSGGA